MTPGESQLSPALESLIDAIGEESTWPGAGAGSGMVVALASGLIEAAARKSSPEWDEAGGVIAQAAALRRRGLRLARQNAEAHLAARVALDTTPPETRREQEIADIHLGDALTTAADLPIAIAEAAVDAAELGALTAERGTHDARADAAGAAALAAGAAVAAAHLVEVNLSTQPGDARLERARALVSSARSTSERALGGSA